ncbi:3-methyl-2-oxobutanoate dehydrogenase subunit VorB [Oleiharenicola sp. Vm1]|uniref:3-methyl-2-oxobutanoate dehydrogenase subunit VorB n=1 Tax=Oleiharenicola sp. Vm1 TaxID=3398393 RepID=UPI0039F5F9F7
MTAPARPKPFLQPEYCKGCLRCVDACPKHCIGPGSEINPATGLIPVELHLDACNGCSLCMQACPEPYGLRPETERAHPDHTGRGDDFDLQDPAKLFGPKPVTVDPARDELDTSIVTPVCEPLVLKGNYAAAIGALFAGCRHVFGYPITPSTEGAELMAKILPKLGGAFVQAVSETAAVNMMYGAGGSGVPCMTFTSGPGFSLMLEGVSYMIGAELPGVFVNVMRGGPGLGNLGPEQADIKLACRGLGHGNTHAIVLAPGTPQEMLDLTMDAFTLSFRYRIPVVILGDGYLGQMTGVVKLPDTMLKRGRPAWAVCGDRGHRHNLISSIELLETDLEKRNEHLNRKYDRIAAQEQRADLYRCDDADVLIVACNTPARMAKGAVEVARAEGLKVGLFRPVTLWPFPIRALADLLPQTKRLIVVEAGPGQLEDELRLALSHAGFNPPRLEHVRRHGGVLPSQREILNQLLGR